MKKKTILIVAVILVLAITGYGAYTIYQIRNPDMLFKKSVPKTDNTENTNKIEQTVASVETTDNDGTVVEEPTSSFKGDKVNVLLLGFDYSPERKDMGVFRTDTMMLVSIDFKNVDVDVLSVPRDSYTEIPGFEGRHKINDAFHQGGSFEGKGFEKAMETVSKFIGGIPVDYYMGVDMTVFKDVIDLIGGVEYDVDVPCIMNGRELEAGLQILSGQQVLDYARNRNTGMADIDRIDRQQRVLLAAFEQMKEKAQITKIPEIFMAVKDDIWTNMNFKQVSGLALFASNINLDNISRYTIPGGFLNTNGLSFWGIKQNEKKEMIKEIYGIDIEVNMEDDIQYIRDQDKKKAEQEVEG